MTKLQVEELFKAANIKILNQWEIMNEYWPRHPDYYKIIIENPWWLIQTEVGMILIGKRKRVVEINWIATPIRKIITEDDVTKSETMVHSWNHSTCLIYLKEIGKLIKELKEQIEQN